MKKITSWYKQWVLKRIILALKIAVEDHGLKPEVASFAATLEATCAMMAGQKKNTPVTIKTTKEELSVFISYMVQLHMTKLSLLTRARIGLVALMVDADKLMPEGQNSMEFAREQFGKAKSSKDDKRVQLIK